MRACLITKRNFQEFCDVIFRLWSRLLLVKGTSFSRGRSRRKKKEWLRQRRASEYIKFCMEGISESNVKLIDSCRRQLCCLSLTRKWRGITREAKETSRTKCPIRCGNIRLEIQTRHQMCITETKRESVMDKHLCRSSNISKSDFNPLAVKSIWRAGSTCWRTFS